MTVCGLANGSATGLDRLAQSPHGEFDMLRLPFLAALRSLVNFSRMKGVIWHGAPSKRHVQRQAIGAYFLKWPLTWPRMKKAPTAPSENPSNSLISLAPRAGFEPATIRL